MKKVLVSTFRGVFVFAIYAMMVSCGKSGSNKVTPPPTNGHTLKFTITVAGIASTGNQGLINLVFNGVEAADPTNKTKTLWKINGAEQQNQTLLKFNALDFPQGKPTTITIESTVPLYSPVVNLHFANATLLPAYTISVKAEEDGKVQVDDESISITGANIYDHTYTY
ncbi:hypothetical protein [Mucilaginibacter sp. SG564]|uniref:hypothetical protein n=1 Tax=unclassified Mucilaginibacter TaxID=2617802 RepID=UPI0015567A3E|nr:hypothetical protein [Mucilaginibacter sp. SG564]NOW98262.1 hypothetical protein [Mucilaginibacter sp. SG564]